MRLYRRHCSWSVITIVTMSYSYLLITDQPLKYATKNTRLALPKVLFYKRYQWLFKVSIVCPQAIRLIQLCCFSFIFVSPATTPEFSTAAAQTWYY